MIDQEDPTRTDTCDSYVWFSSLIATPFIFYFLRGALDLALLRSRIDLSNMPKRLVCTVIVLTLSAFFRICFRFAYAILYEVDKYETFLQSDTVLSITAISVEATFFGLISLTSCFIELQLEQIIRVLPKKDYFKWVVLESNACAALIASSVQIIYYIAIEAQERQRLAFCIIFSCALLAGCILIGAAAVLHA